MHEKTRPDKEDDRTRHTLALRANAGPVFLMFRDQPAVAELLTAVDSQAPWCDFAADDGVRHTVWKLSPRHSAALQEAFLEVPAAYVADGHHRAAAAYRAALHLRQEQPEAGATAAHNGFLSVLFPASQLQVLPYHRAVRGLNKMSPEELLARIGNNFQVEACEGPAEPAAPGEAGLYLNGSWYRLHWSVPGGDDPVAALDAAVLQSRLLDPLLGIGDPRTDQRLAFVGGSRGVAELERLVDGGVADAAFALYPVTVEQIMTVADQGLTLPPKSTWFEPKLRSGLLVHTLDGN